MQNKTNGKERSQDVRIGFYVCHCGVNIAGTIDVAAVANYAAKLPNVVVSRHYKYMCSDPGQGLLKKAVAEAPIVVSCMIRASGMRWKIVNQPKKLAVAMINIKPQVCFRELNRTPGRSFILRSR